MILTLIFLCFTVVGSFLFPSVELQNVERECFLMSEKVSLTDPASSCQTNINENGEAACRCELPSTFTCPDLNEGLRFNDMYEYRRMNGSNRIIARACKYKISDRTECEIEWQETWRCGVRDGQSVGFRKGLLLTPPGRHGKQCYDKYIGFSHCLETGYCEMRHERMCSLTKESYTFYNKCAELVNGLRNISSNGQASSEFETIICTPRITSSGELECLCTNPYEEMKANMTALRDEKCPGLGQADALYDLGWRLRRRCLYHHTNSSTCRINWVGKIRRSFFNISDNYGDCSDSDVQNERLLVGKIETPHGGSGTSCDEVYNASIRCEGLWCLQLCMKIPDVAVALFKDESVVCQNYSMEQAERLRRKTKQRICWGCITKRHGSACFAVAYNGIRRCKCMLFFNPDRLMLVAAEKFKDFTQGWQNGVQPWIFGTSFSFRQPGNRIFAHFGQRPDSFFAAYFEAAMESSIQPDILWSGWRCLGDGRNTQERSGHLQILAGVTGYKAFHENVTNANVSCSGYLCGQVRKNYIDCWPQRAVTSEDKCRCEIGWTRTINRYGDIVCGEEHGGCCNPSGAAWYRRPDTGYCPIVDPNSCLNRTQASSSGLSANCKPLSRKNNPCHAWWFVKESSKCPFGRALPGHVTLPKEAYLPEYLCVAYGYVPYAVAACALLEFIIRRGTRSLSFILFNMFIVALGELFFKRIVRHPRPELSCLHSCGMPSSHASISVGYFVIMLIDASWRQMNNIRTSRQLSIRNSRWTVIPLLHSNSEVTSPRRFLGWVGFWFCLLIPVPVTRVLLHDHTPVQVLVGGMIGLCEALVWFFLMLQFEMRAKAHFGETRFGITHDLELTSGMRLPFVGRFSTELTLAAHFSPTGGVDDSPRKT